MGNNHSHMIDDLRSSLGLAKSETEKVKLENKRIKQENKKLEEENRENELRREQEKKILEEENRENEFRRAQELVKQMKEKEEIQEQKRKLEEERQELLEKLRKEEERRRMSEMARQIEEEAKSRVEREVCLRKQAEDDLEKGIPPVKYPNGEEFQAVRNKHKYKEGFLHIAIAGVSGSGKSSLINAFRGYMNGVTGKGLAKTGTIETTKEIKRYHGTYPKWIRWYDIPGAGTLDVPYWQYFNEQGLYIFDIIIIAIDIRFTETDIALLFHCKRFGIPTFVVRSKADQHILNTMRDDRGSDSTSENNNGNGTASSDDSDSDSDSEEEEGYDDCDDSNNDDGNIIDGAHNDDDSHEKRYERARSKFTTGTRSEFKSILERVQLPQQKVYIVSSETLCSLVKNKKSPAKTIDEEELVSDILTAASERHRQKQTPY